MACEANKCLLCHDAPCTKACDKGLEVASIIRSIRFENKTGAMRKLGETDVCKDCSAPCMDACRKSDIDEAIKIPTMFAQLRNEKILENDRR